jgi:hypothetical protein
VINPVMAELPQDINTILSLFHDEAGPISEGMYLSE